MSRTLQMNLIIVLLIITAVSMIYLGYKGDMYPPKLTGVGFLFVAWAIQVIKNKLESGLNK
jgi:heme O synthase-like polyprenyltransferase